MNRSEPLRITGAQSGEATSSAARKSMSPAARASPGPKNCGDARVVFHIVELGAVCGVGHHQLRPAVTEAMLDSLRSESSEQRLVDRADPPRAEDQRHQFGNARQHAGHEVAGAHAETFEQGADAARHIGQIVEGVFAQFIGGRDRAQRQPIFAGIAAAAFHIGVDAGRRIAVEARDLVLDAELRNGILIARQRLRLGYSILPRRRISSS